MGETTAATLMANAVAPGLLDRYLGRFGYTSQQTSRPNPPDAPVDLWEPADGPDGHDFGAHGIFDKRAHAHSPQVWLSLHHGLVASGLAVAAGAVARARW